MKLNNKVQLITYPDSLGRNLLELHWVLRKYLRKRIGGIHLLPFYPSSADRGFAPLTYDEVDPNFGSWRDVEKIGEDFDLIVDFMVNHISRQSVYFQDYLEKGKASEFADMFLSFDKLSADGDIPESELTKVYTRKPRHPYTVIERADGSKERLWCTFDYEQIDLDCQSPKTREIMRAFLIQLARSRVKMIRMDAFAYTTVKIGTNCFFQEPEVWDLLKWLKHYVAPFGTQILPEVHERHTYQQRLAEKGYWAYDFALPMLVLHTLYNRTNRELADWLEVCPRKQINTLDTHDGIGVVDVKGLLTDGQIQETVDNLYERGSNVKRIYSGPKYQNLDIYQVNCTYYSALGCNDDAYIAARAIQFYAPGIPQVYYVGLLAGQNDIELVERTRNGRNINRHNYTLEEIETEIQKPVVRRLLRLMAFRSRYPAFGGKFSVDRSREDRLVLTWTKDIHRTEAEVDLASYRTVIRYHHPRLNRQVSFSA
jgi:sucrose phosphorylase